ncbi:hypothetical protein [Microbacterium sp. 4-7]|uniref:hypothetical protein n=1 Tax=Microbacterium sp. 4-7 TaxID=1885327 RepID=UPI001650A363|nr:hypothetical protein [Microbacterium sp. 4-7]MBC6496118.1 hypothetical protein [Microbacterium sp. 4-7]
MTIDNKLDITFTDPTLPTMPHGVGVIPAGGETPYRWLADDLTGEAGSLVTTWRETNGAGNLTGGGASLATVAGYKSVAFDGSNGLQIASGSPLPSSRGTICGVARLSPAALEATRYGLIALSSSVNVSDGKISKETSGKMLFDRIGTADVKVASADSILPGQFFTFGFSQRTAGAVAMLNGVNFAVGAGDIGGFARFFLGTIGSGVNWLGNVFELALWNEGLVASHFTQFHNAMKTHYSFIQ